MPQPIRLASGAALLNCTFLLNSCADRPIPADLAAAPAQPPPSEPVEVDREITLTAAGTGPGRTVRVRVTARVAEDPTPRPVRDARVTALGTTVRTDTDGYARVPANSGTVTASAGGFKPVTLSLP